MTEIRVGAIAASAGAIAAALGACNFFVPFAEYDKNFDPSPASCDACTDATSASDARTVTDAGVGSECDADRQRDPRHCGACGHDCLGANCTEGICGAETLVDDPAATPTSLAIDESTAYVTFVLLSGLQGGILHISKTNLRDRGLLVGPIAPPLSVRLTDAHVYWVQGAIGDAGAMERGVGRVPKIGVDASASDASTPLLVSGQASPYQLMLDRTSMFWTNAPSPGDLWTADRLGNTARSLVSPSGAEALAVDDDFIFWTVRSTGSIWRARKDGAEKLAIATNQNAPLRVITSGDAIYWSNSTTSGSLMTAQKDGGAPTRLVDRQHAPGPLASDGDYLYWANVGDRGAHNGAIMRVRKNGGGLLSLALGQESPIDIAVDGTHVYWVADRKALRVPK